MINLNDYEKFVTSLMSEASMKTLETKLATAGLGLAGEGGECADLVKKILFHGLPLDETTIVKLKKELGDLMFYIAFTAQHVCNTNVQEIIDLNYTKLSDRYKDGKFSVDAFLAKEAKKNE